MRKINIYVELFARFMVLTVALPFTVVFLFFYALGFIAEYFFTGIVSFSRSTKELIATIDEHEPETANT